METRIPENTRRLLSSLLLEGEGVIYNVSADIDENGNFGEIWLFLTTKRVIIINPVTKNINQFPLSDIRASFIKDYLGNSELFFETTNGLKSVLRFSRERLDEFYNLAKLVDKIAKGELKPENIDLETL
ncbi:MAG: PH domain-containing protein, partial [Candidatus Bathyarchaeia archaeon]